MPPKRSLSPDAGADPMKRSKERACEEKEEGQGYLKGEVNGEEKKKQKHIFELSQETLHQIWEFTLNPDPDRPGEKYIQRLTGGFLGETSQTEYQMPGLLLACKSIFRAALPLYYQGHIFVFSVNIRHLDIVLKWLRGRRKFHRDIKFMDSLRSLQVHIKLSPTHDDWHAVYMPAQITKFCCKFGVTVRFTSRLYQQFLPLQFAPIIAGRIIGYHAYKESWKYRRFFSATSHIAKSLDFTRFPGDVTDLFGPMVQHVHASPCNGDGKFKIDYRVIYTVPRSPNSLGQRKVKIRVVVKYQGRLVRLKDHLSCGPLEGEHVDFCDYSNCSDASCWHHMLNEHQDWLADLLPNTPQIPQSNAIAA
jgi:hypothetical protein